MNTKDLHFNFIHPLITQAHFDQFTAEIFDRKIPILDETSSIRRCVVPFSSNSEAEEVLNFIQEFALDSLRVITGHHFECLPFEISLRLTPEGELARIKRHENIQMLELKQLRLEEKQAKKAELLYLQQEVFELEAALEVMELELQVSQAEKRLKKARKAQMDREHEALKALKMEVEMKEKLCADIERLNMAAEAYDLVEVEPPYWTDNSKWKEFEKVTMEWYTVSSISVGSTLIKMKQESGEMRMKAKPFAKGTFRLAYYAQVKRKGQVTNMTAKAFIEPSRKGDDSNLLSNIETQVLSRKIAVMFCQANKATAVEFLEAIVVRVPGKYNYFVEPYLVGNWKRFTNNKGYVNEDEEAPTIHAFSHYSYQVSGQYVLVVDIQGARTSSGYLLTDPAIHCQDPTKYGCGGSNWDAEGFDEFFKTHECNSICKKLGLIRHAKQLKPDNTSPIVDNH